MTTMFDPNTLDSTSPHRTSPESIESDAVVRGRPAAGVPASAVRQPDPVRLGLLAAALADVPLHRGPGAIRLDHETTDPLEIVAAAVVDLRRRRPGA